MRLIGYAAAGERKTWTNRHDRLASHYVAPEPAGAADRVRHRHGRRIRTRPTTTPGAGPGRVPATAAASSWPKRPAAAAAGRCHPAFDRDRLGQGRLFRDRGYALANRPIG